MKNEKNLTFSNILRSKILGLINNNSIEVSNSDFPKKINQFKFKKRLKQNHKSRAFKFAMYQNSKGQKAIAKMWSGKIKKYEYLTFTNEIVMYKLLNSVHERETNLIKKKFKNVRIPKLFDIYEDDHRIILLTEYIRGNNLTKLDEHIAFEHYSKCHEYYKFLGTKLSSEEKKRISVRNMKQILFLYPILLGMSINNHPSYTKYLLKGIPKVLRALSNLIKRSNLTLSHRDLYLTNILKSKNKIYLIDLEFSLLSDELYELINTFKISYSKKILSEKVIDKIHAVCKKENITYEELLALITISATHGLSGRNITNGSKLYCKNLLLYTQETLPITNKYININLLINR